MKEHFTKEAKELWDKADKRASLLGHSFTGPEHILLAFFETNSDLANLVMEEHTGSYEMLSSKVAEMSEGKVYIQSTTETLLRKAQKEANLSFSSSIDVKHILSAVFDSNKEEKNIPTIVLQDLEINIDWFMKLVKYPRSIRKDAPVKEAEKGSLLSGQKSGGIWTASSALDKYGRDLTALAQKHQLDPVALREKEIDNIIEVLCRRVKSNPLLVGEPGVGKSAMMVGLAQRIVEGNVPDKLKNNKIFELNITSIIAGASLQGEFEKRMTNIINHVKKEKNILLFIDEIHSIVGAGGAPGLGDAANILKAPLVNGEIKCIGATTLKEYRKYIERDPALARRFQTIEIREPSVDETVQIIKSIKHLYEEFHLVKLPEKVINKAVELSVMHIKDQYLPDKAIDLIDQACAHLSLSGRSNQEKVVSFEDVAVVISHKTKIPLEKITLNNLDKLLHLEELLKQRVLGQEEAIDKVGDIIRLTKSGLDLKPVRPDGVFLFIGPTGVGKTELARVLSETMFGDEGKIIRLDMSEYMEPHSVSKLIGSPPGYIGSDQEGGLTGKIRTEPNSIVLLDEVEKAHPDVLNVFLQVFEDGRLTDSHGRTVYFSNSTIIMTSNVGAAKAFTKSRDIGFNEQVEIDFKGTEKILRESIRKYFSPEFLNRIDEVIYFRPLGRKAIKDIARMKLHEIKNRFAAEHKEIKVSDEVLDLISEKGFNPEFGARFLNRTIEDLVLKLLSRTILSNPDERSFAVGVDPAQGIIILGGAGKKSDKHRSRDIAEAE